MLHRVPEHGSQCCRLLHIHNLLHIPQIQRLFSNLKAIFPSHPGFNPIIFHCFFKEQLPFKFRHHEIRHIRLFQRIFFQHGLHLLCDIHRPVRIHLNYRIRDMKERPGASGHEHRGNSTFLIEIPCPFQKRSDWLFFPVNHTLHKAVPHHEIGSRGILIQKKNLTSRLHTLHNSRSLRSTSAGIRGGEAVGVFFIWKIIDEKRDIDFPN